MNAPETKYAKSGNVHIAYQVFGEGPPDLVFVNGFLSNVEHMWEHPHVARFFERLASFSRVILFDKRGSGLSDAVTGAPPLEVRIEDVQAVMEAAGADRVVLFGASEGSAMSILFAATHPERISALLLSNAFARFAPDPPDYPWGERYMDIVGQTLMEIWGQGLTLNFFAPSLMDDERLRRWWAGLERKTASPGMVRNVFVVVNEVDVRRVLPAVGAPTLVIARTEDLISEVAEMRYIADRIPGARFVELPGDTHFPWVGDFDPLLDEVQEFITGARPIPETDRMLATLLFTDIVGSTERAAELGDAAWKELLESHDELVRGQLERFRGREIATAGDSFFAMFDGPARAIRCAQAIVESIRGLGLEVRSGLHTGEVELAGEDVRGIAVHIGARVAAMGGTGEVLVSSTVKDLVAGSGIEFTDRGAHDLKGVPGEWRLFAVTGS